jgi:outer membrane protein OmpA-like peptidoglycan-associated protein/flagellar hook assembly protein FlgD
MKISEKRMVVLVFLVLLFVPATLFAGGQAEGVTQLNIPSQERQYISPANEDGVKDILELPFSQFVAPAEDAVIVEYELTIFDSTGEPVFTVREIETERRGFFGNITGAEKPQVEVPDTLTWDGTYQIEGEARNGELVEDGDYTYQLTVVDDEGRVARSAPFNVTVDNEPPIIDPFPQPPYLVFSPNDDDIRDTVSIPQSGSRELRWTMSVLTTDGTVVYERVAENSNFRNRSLDIPPPSPFVWDGRDNDGELVPEGQYVYRLEGEDRAGNVNSQTLDSRITMSLQAGQIQLSSADGDRRAFSPNDDGTLDTLPLNVRVNEPEGLATWELVLHRNDESGRVVYSEEGSAPLPNRIVLEGRSAIGDRLSDGNYVAVMNARYENGTPVSSEPFPVRIDTQPPQASVNVETVPEETREGAPIVFGGEGKNGIRVEVDATPGEDWIVELDAFGDEYSMALSEIGVEETEFSYTWYGSIPGMEDPPDGTYELQMVATDEAGNTGSSQLLRITKDTRDASVDVTIDGTYLSPRAPGAQGEIPIRLDYEPSDGIDEFLLEIRNSEGDMVRSRYVRQPFDRFVWDGFTNGNTAAPDGEYSVWFQVKYYNGNEPEAEDQGPIIVDGTPPRIERLEANRRTISPDGDGERDDVTITQRVVPGDDWTAEVRNADGDVVAQEQYEDQVRNFTWDGRDQDGDVVPDGEYVYVLHSEDAAGNRTVREIPLLVDTMGPRASEMPPDLSMEIEPKPFSPDGDGVDDTVRITLGVESPNDLRRWSLRIMDPRGDLFRSYSGSGRPRRTIVWDGRANDGELVQAAVDYTAEYTVVDEYGNSTTIEDAIPVDILVMPDGDRLRIMIQSIHFAGFSSDLFETDTETLEDNLQTIRRLAEILNKYDDRDIIIEGHAAHLLHEPEAQRREQQQVLLPLSRDRATEVMQALIILGVDRERMEVVGYGGSRPVVPHTNYDELWKNRRVEFLLEARRSR